MFLESVQSHESLLYSSSTIVITISLYFHEMFKYFEKPQWRLQGSQRK